MLASFETHLNLGLSYRSSFKVYGLKVSTFIGTTIET